MINETKNMIDDKLLELLVCPVTKGKLEYNRKKCCLVSHQAGLVFPIIDGIPHMALDTALSLDANDQENTINNDQETSKHGE